MDQRGFDNQDESTVTAAEAARLLGVKLATLYAYTSRGLLQSVPIEGSRARRYLRADVDRLKQRHDARAGHTAVAANALRWGEPVLDTRVTRIDADGPHYRGQSAVALAKAGTPFESVAELLWTGVLPPEPPRMTAPDLGFAAARMPPHLSPLMLLTVAAPLIAAHDAARFASPEEVERVRAGRLIRRLAGSLALAGQPDRVKPALRASSLAGALVAGWNVRGRTEATRALNAVLVLCADHELNPSSFAVRVAASTGADLYACVGAGLAVISGPKHGGMCDRVEALVREAGQPGHAADAIHERLGRGETIPGFGHPLYPDGDPRTPPLLELARAFAPGNEAVRTLDRICAVMADGGYGQPSVDFGIVAVAAALGLPRGSATVLFALGRTAGWIANALEQREAGYVLRPRARYVGSDLVAKP